MKSIPFMLLLTLTACACGKSLHIKVNCIESHTQTTCEVNEVDEESEDEVNEAE